MVFMSGRVKVVFGERRLGAVDLSLGETQKYAPFGVAGSHHALRYEPATQCWFLRSVGLLVI
jgi:hypothetical protein